MGRLQTAQLDKASDLALGLGQLLFGSTVLPYIIPNIDRPAPFVVILGVIIAIILWRFALFVVRRK